MIERVRLKWSTFSECSCLWCKEYLKFHSYLGAGSSREAHLKGDPCFSLLETLQFHTFSRSLTLHTDVLKWRVKSIIHLIDHILARSLPLK